MKSEYIKNWETQFKKGVLPLFVLSLIVTKEMYGYELILELKSQYDLDVTESTMYPLLIRMMKEGLLEHKWVEQQSGIPRKYYSIKEEGRSVLEEMRVMFQNINLKVN